MNSKEREYAIDFLAGAVPARILKRVDMTRQDVRERYSEMSDEALRVTRLFFKAASQGFMEQARGYLESTTPRVMDEIEAIHLSLIHNGGPKK